MWPASQNSACRPLGTSSIELHMEKVSCSADFTGLRINPVRITFVRIPPPHITSITINYCWRWKGERKKMLTEQNWTLLKASKETGWFVTGEEIRWLPENYLHGFIFVMLVLQENHIISQQPLWNLLMLWHTAELSFYSRTFICRKVTAQWVIYTAEYSLDLILVKGCVLPHHRSSNRVRARLSQAKS